MPRMSFISLERFLNLVKNLVKSRTLTPLRKNHETGTAPSKAVETTTEVGRVGKEGIETAATRIGQIEIMATAPEKEIPIRTDALAKIDIDHTRNGH